MLVLIRLNLLAAKWGNLGRPGTELKDCGVTVKDADCFHTAELFGKLIWGSPSGAKLLDQRTFACVPVAEHLGTESAPKVEEQIRTWDNDFAQFIGLLAVKCVAYAADFAAALQE